jgi:hypothetical protein
MMDPRFKTEKAFFRSNRMAIIGNMYIPHLASADLVRIGL